MKMYNQKKSLYLILSPIIILTVVLVISINSTISYITTKNQIINDIKNDSNRMIVELRNNIKNLMDSYSVNEYEKLLHNEMESNEILFAIVVKDYNLGKLLGKEYEIRGKTREENLNVIDFDYENETHKKLISQAYYEKHFDITNEESKKIGTISLYLSDRTLNKELDKIISNNVKEALIISLILILLLFLTIRYFVLKPLNDMIEVINNADKDGIPTEKFSSSGSKEIFTDRKSVV